MSTAHENNLRTEALKAVHENEWVGNIVHPNLDRCLTAINLNSANSGWYKPTATRVNGIKGWYMLNSDGTIYYESRVIKEGDNEYRIEYMTGNGYTAFERAYSNATTKVIA